MKYILSLLGLFTILQVFPKFSSDIIPFKIVNGHIRVEIIINDSPLDFVFDTGAATNLLSLRTANRLGLELSGNTDVQGAAGSSKMQMVRNEQFTIGQTLFKRQHFAVMDISHLGDEGNPIDGIIGSSILSQYVVEIDYDKEQLVLHESIKALDISSYKAFKYSLSPYNIPIIETTLELDNGKQLTGKYFVDTGAALAIMFNSNLVKEEGLIDKLGEHYPIISTSLSNSETDQVSLLPKFTLFGFDFEDFSVRLSQAKQGVSSFKGYHGIIGFYLLKRFNTIFDYGNERMYVKPNGHFEDAFPRDHSGLQVRKSNGHYEVINVAKHSAGAEAKIQIGDVIETVDGKTFQSRGELARYFQKTDLEVEIKLKRNGAAMTIKMRPKSTIN